MAQPTASTLIGAYLCCLPSTSVAPFITAMAAASIGRPLPAALRPPSSSSTDGRST